MNLETQARRIVAAGAEHGVALRLLGGLAVRIHSPSAARPELARDYADIDLFSPERHLEPVFAALSYRPDREFNLLNGDSRQIYHPEDGAFRVDVFVGEFEMCHRIPLAGRMEVDVPTVPLAELLLTKLQIVEANEKDLLDIWTLLSDHPVGESDEETIHRGRIEELCSRDWGLWRTVMGSLDKTESFGRQLSGSDLVLQRIDELRTGLRDCRKSSGWKLRSLVGERLRWYELPEEVER
ncbi:MAG: hypothetical protein HY319_19320 [Armatimonadetes bacterium]|nr:hypothetical protein [Armatimonadota bacterium]